MYEGTKHPLPAYLINGTTNSIQQMLSSVQPAHYLINKVTHLLVVSP